MALNRPLGMMLAALVLGCDANGVEPRVLEATTSRAVAEGDDPTVVAPDAVSTPALGAREPRVVVTIFGDYQCPNCKRMHDLAARLVDRWPDAVQVQFRQLPLRMHPLARPAALAVLAAHRQGKFACMHTALTRTRSEWGGLATEAFLAYVDSTLVSYCNLDGRMFVESRRDPRLGAKIDADSELAADLKVRGTPTVLVDGLEAKLWPRAGVQPALLLNALVRRGLREGETGLEDKIYGNLGDAALTMRLLDAE